MPFSNIFTVVNVYSILLLDQRKMTSISNSFEQLSRIIVCFSRLFSRPGLS